METDLTSFDLILTVLMGLLTAAVPVVVPFLVMAFRAIKNEKAQKLVLLLIEQLHLAIKTGVDASMASGTDDPEAIYREAVAHAEKSNPELMKKVAPKGKDTPPRDALINIAKSVLSNKLMVVEGVLSETHQSN